MKLDFKKRVENMKTAAYNAMHTIYNIYFYVKCGAWNFITENLLPREPPTWLLGPHAY